MTIKYDKYLNSKWWAYLRERRLKKNDSCEICGERKSLQIHHFNYKNKYANNPHKALKHTRVLCDRCHTAFHKQFGVKKDMTREMKLFIAQYRREVNNARQGWEEIHEKENWIKSLSMIK